MIAGRFSLPPTRRSRRGGGFTLIEMMMALAVFVLLAAAVFGLMLGVLQGTSTLQDNQDRHDVVDALNAFLKNKFSGMSALATLSSYKRGDGEGLVQNGIVIGTASQATAIDAKLQPNGYYLLRLATYSAPPSSAPAPSNGTGGIVTPGTINQPVFNLNDARTNLVSLVTSDDPTVVWTPLVTDIKSLSWKFQDVGALDWADLWAGNGKPAFVEFTMLPAGDLKATRMDFWLPKIDQITLNVPTGTNAP